ncbi:helix-turn-helix domain-containing protein [Paenibacillus sp. GCM10027626]|uniref:helix-turn-helix domain-containing protein n=1 Tax=Paenibacillus sp. GCM10027626 TaxID=3273411 RepID=UPI00362A3350
MRRNWFHRLLLSYLPVFFVISLSLLLITYLTLSEMSKRSAVKANELLSQSVMQAVDNALRGIDETMIREITGNGRVKAFFTTERVPLGQYTDYEAVSALQRMMNDNRLIGSIYLYRVVGQAVLTPAMLADIDKFGDKTFIGAHITSTAPYRWEAAHAYRERPESKPEDVVSLVKFANLLDRSLMVVNVNVRRLSELIGNMADSKLNYVELVGQDGNVIASNAPSAVAGTPSGRGANAGKEWSSVTSDYTGWTVRSGIYKANIVDWVSSLFYVWIFFGFSIIALGIVWLVYVTRRNYRPIRTIVSRIDEYARQKRHELPLSHKGDELRLIETAIEDLLDRSDMLQERSEQNLAYRKRHVLRTMLEGVPAGKGASWQQELEQFGVDGVPAGYSVVIVELDGYSGFVAEYGRSDQYLLKHVLSVVVQEITEPEPVDVWSEWVASQRLAVVCMLKAGVPEDWEETPVFETLRQWVEQHLPYTVTIGIGSRQQLVEHVAVSYQEAEEGLDYKSSLGTNRLIGPDDLASMPPGEMFRQLHTIRALCQSFRSGDKEWEAHFGELHATIVQRLFARGDATSLLNYLIYHLHKELLELPVEFQDIWNGGVHERLNAIVEQRETVHDMLTGFREVLVDADQRMRNVRERRNRHPLIHQVKRYIADNYANSELSLAHLSGEFGVSASYLSRLFKDEFGEKFNDYVARVRIDRAIELLKESEATVGDIAAAVGYGQTLTFIRVFKKATGNTPGNYRKDMG